jgi:hypothetical protein
MRRRELLVTVGTGLAMVAVPLGWACADHVKIQGAGQAPAQPYQAPAPAPMIRADHIKAQQIRADTIYANKIGADNIQGQIHQSKDVKVGANSIVAQNVYVRDLRRP